MSHPSSRNKNGSTNLRQYLFSKIWKLPRWWLLTWRHGDHDVLLELTEQKRAQVLLGLRSSSLDIGDSGKSSGVLHPCREPRRSSGEFSQSSRCNSSNQSWKQCDHRADWVPEEGSKSTIADHTGVLATTYGCRTEDWHHHCDHRPCGMFSLKRNWLQRLKCLLVSVLKDLI